MLEEVTQEFFDAKNYPFRRQSAVDKSLYFHEHQWVVSVLNTKEKEFGGHAVILVEGIKDSQLFIGRYDVFAATGDQDLSGQSSFFSVLLQKPK